MIAGISFPEFRARASRRAETRRIPYSGSIELTSRCNLRCIHCYINRPADDSAESAAELTAREWKDQIDAMADRGCLWLLLTGGEPLLRPDFFEIFEHAKRKGIFVTVFTNGTLVMPELAKQFADLPPLSVEITIYGAEPGIHDRITGMAGSFERALKGMDLLRENGLHVELKTMALTPNVHQLSAMERLAAKMGSKFRYDPMINPRLDSDKGPLQYRLSAEEVVLLDKANEKRLTAWKEYCGRSIGPISEPEMLYHCGAGMESFHVDSAGRFSICMMDRKKQYNLRTGTFSEAWDVFAKAIRFQKRSIQSKCSTCELLSVCSQCPAWFSLESGNGEEPLEYFCRIAEMRAEAFAPNRGKSELVR